MAPQEKCGRCTTRGLHCQIPEGQSACLGCGAAHVTCSPVELEPFRNAQRIISMSSSPDLNINPASMVPVNTPATIPALAMSPDNARPNPIIAQLFGPPHEPEAIAQRSEVDALARRVAELERVNARLQEQNAELRDAVVELGEAVIKLQRWGAAFPR